MTSEVNLLEQNVDPALDDREDWFVPGQYDARYAYVKNQLFYPKNSVESQPWTFDLPAIRGNGVYKIDEAVLVASIDLRQSNPGGAPTVPPADSKTCIANNLLNTLFSKSEVCINGVPINTDQVSSFMT